MFAQLLLVVTAEISISDFLLQRAKRTLQLNLAPSMFLSTAHNPNALRLFLRLQQTSRSRSSSCMGTGEVDRSCTYHSSVVHSLDY